jgi:hypothetical protein
MRKMLAGAVALPILFVSFNSFAGGPAFWGGVAQGYQQAEMQSLCVQAMQNYVRGAGPVPPAFCAAASAPQQPTVTCNTQHFGNGMSQTTCR